jgi:cell division protein FtsB
MKNKLKLRLSLREAARILNKPISEALAIVEADTSFSEIENVLRNYLRVNRREGGGCWPAWKYLRATYDTYFVYECADTNDIDRLYKATYTYSDGQLTVGESVEVRCEVRYIPVTEAISEAKIHEAFVGSIRESSITDAGTALVKIIDPGIGSSGYYSAEVLKRAAEAGKFAKGTQMMANHMTEAERKARPEGDVRNVCMVLLEDGYWLDDGPEGAAVYAKSEIMEHERSFVKSVAKHTGLSIDGNASYHYGEVDGREMRIIDEILEVGTIDLVTKAGRGGQIVSIQEARRISESATPTNHDNAAPPKDGPVEHTEEKTTVTEAEIKALKARNDALETENTQLKEAQKVIDLQPAARTAAREAIGDLSLPSIVADRIVESHATRPIIKDGALDKEAFQSAVKESAAEEARIAEAAYNWGGGKVEGMGATGGTTATVRESAPAIRTALQSIGL